MTALPNVKEQILYLLDQLTDEQQQNVLHYVKSIKKPLPPGEPAEQFIARATALGFTSEDLAEMETAIEEAFEQIEEFPDVDLDADENA